MLGCSSWENICKDSKVFTSTLRHPSLNMSAVVSWGT